MSKQANNSSYIKTFDNCNCKSSGDILWKKSILSSSSSSSCSTLNREVITPKSDRHVHISSNLYVDGTICNPSDISLKQNIKGINLETTNKLMKLEPSEFTFKNDPTNKIHYGFIAQDFEEKYPELTEIKPDKNNSNIKAINYLELIPLLVCQIQGMQKEITLLNDKLNRVNKEDKPKQYKTQCGEVFDGLSEWGMGIE